VHHVVEGWWVAEQLAELHKDAQKVMTCGNPTSSSQPLRSLQSYMLMGSRA